MNWLAGTAWLSAWCALGGALELDCDGAEDGVVAARGDSFVEADPFIVWASDSCSTLGSVQRDWRARARASLAATESYLIAREVWDGAIAAEDAVSTPLASAGADIVTAAAAAPVDALACVDAGLLEAGHGAQGLVHVTPQLLTHLAAAGAIERVGQVWQTAMGNLVVADAGYSGNGPAAAAGATQWVYGTSMMRYRLSEVFTVPGDDDQPAAGFAVAINNVAVFAMRAVLVEWDPCVHVAAEVNVAVCGGA